MDSDANPSGSQFRKHALRVHGHAIAETCNLTHTQHNLIHTEKSKKVNCDNEAKKHLNLSNTLLNLFRQ